MRDETVKLRLVADGEATERPITLAIVAMGGQGGGVLTSWIVDLAENAGWVAQSTSVPGVAQRTGATIYYVEMMQAKNGQKPILAQMPTPGDVDIVLASEFVEAGRSILRGIVTPERTTLIASSHRSFAISEKTAPGEGIADGQAVTDAIGVTARHSIIFDMNALANAHGSVISSAMFGALAASGALPFTVDQFHAVIERGGKGVKASISSFDAAYERAINGAPSTPDDDAKVKRPVVAHYSAPLSPAAQGLLQRLDRNFAISTIPMVRAGLAKVVDFQDINYGLDYLTMVEALHATDILVDGAAHDFEFTRNAAKYLANAMAYDDVIRVADLKTRASRKTRIRDEIGLSTDQIFHTTEFMHPRMEEVVGVLPAKLGAWLRGKTGLYNWLDRRISKGRRVKTYSPGWFLMLYFVAGLRRFRRGSLRHRQEVDHYTAWMKFASETVAQDYALGVEILMCRRLIKGYSDTHARGQSKFDKVMAVARQMLGRKDAADWVRRLRQAGIRDGEGGDLDGMIKTVHSFL